MISDSKKGQENGKKGPKWPLLLIIFRSGKGMGVQEL